MITAAVLDHIRAPAQHRHHRQLLAVAHASTTIRRVPAGVTLRLAVPVLDGTDVGMLALHELAAEQQHALLVQQRQPTHAKGLVVAGEHRLSRQQARLSSASQRRQYRAANDEVLEVRQRHHATRKRAQFCDAAGKRDGVSDASVARDVAQQRHGIACGQCGRPRLRVAALSRRARVDAASQRDERTDDVVGRQGRRRARTRERLNRIGDGQTHCLPRERAMPAREAAERGDGLERLAELRVGVAEQLDVF
mmetsp:Transcript_6502/g.23144  ORF Transcript_6502/g.23144 Transcript_6502/m.23144 type:complete len:251 (-) Transcript_6502:1468-2220(-)